MKITNAIDGGADRNIKDWLFKTESGDYVYSQQPNAPMLAAFVFLVLKIILNKYSSLVSILEVLQFLSLLAWALLELFQAVNNFRRILGTVAILILLLIVLGRL